MAICKVNKIDSNVTSLAIAQEECPKQLPASPIWYVQEPNSFSDFGADVSTVSRSPIDPSRQNLKGVLTTVDAVAGFNTDLTKTNLTALMQGFCFANARQDFSTAPLNGATTVITSVTSADSKYNAASGLAGLVANDLIFASGFINKSNNGLKKVVSSIATDITTTGLVSETPPSTAKIERVGREFVAGDVKSELINGRLVLTASAGAFNTTSLIAGQWVFLGGDVATSQLSSNIGYARILSVTAKVLTFDLTTFTAVAATGSGIALQIFWGTVIRNEPSRSDIVTRSYQLERQLGYDDNGIQSEYVIGAVPSEFTLSIPTEDKITVDLTFVGLDSEQRTGATGVKAGQRVTAKGEQAYNTSSDIYRNRMYVLDDTTTLPTPLFGYISEGSLEINNNVESLKAVGVLGGFDVSVGMFEVGGSVTAYFTSIAAVQAVRKNSDVGFYSISAANNGGFLFDIPLMGISGGQLAVESDSPITIPIDNAGAKSKFGYTLLTEFFSYLPNVAMPQ